MKKKEKNNFQGMESHGYCALRYLKRKRRRKIREREKKTEFTFWVIVCSNHWFTGVNQFVNVFHESYIRAMCMNGGYVSRRINIQRKLQYKSAVEFKNI